ncbi:MAG TPA: hypothetical protein VFC44_17415 [Candidatus Saccharimonadales bacterium]|nr:hypothetical protein [Candidatus Saccharimonadales bacterium]
MYQMQQQSTGNASLGSERFGTVRPVALVRPDASEKDLQTRIKQNSLITRVLAILTMVGFLLPSSNFAEDLQSPNGDDPVIRWAVGASNIESTNLAMRAVFTFSKDSKPGTLAIVIRRPPGGPWIYMHDVRVHVFSSSGKEIPFVSGWPDNIVLCGVSNGTYSEANAIFKSAVNGVGSQLPKRVQVTYKNVTHQFAFKDTL